MTKKIQGPSSYKIHRKERKVTAQNNILEEKELLVEAESSKMAYVIYKDLKKEVFECKTKLK